MAKRDSGTASPDIDTISIMRLHSAFFIQKNDLHSAIDVVHAGQSLPCDRLLRTLNTNQL